MSILFRRYFFIVVMLMVVAGFGSWSVAQTAAMESESEPKSESKKVDSESKEVTKILDAKSEEVLRKMCSLYEAADSVRCKAEVTMEIKMREQSKKMNLIFDVAMKRPDKFYMAIKGDDDLLILCNGKEMISYRADRNMYQRMPMPKGGAANLIAQSGSVFGALLVKVPYEAVLRNLTPTMYIGEEEVNGKKCHHIKLTYPGMDRDLWIDAGENAVLVRSIEDNSHRLREIDPNGKNVSKMEYKWEFDVDMADDKFVFVAPEGATEESDKRPNERPRSEADGLIGKVAPDFELPLLDGGQFKLSGMKGKKIVVLDFWATWCGPCVTALPRLAKIAERYKGRDVVVYPVNVGEKQEVVKRFVDEKRLVFTGMALDKYNSVSRSYKVRGIPQTVLIGKDGVVKSVHVGFNEGALIREIEELMDSEEGESAGE